MVAGADLSGGEGCPSWGPGYSIFNGGGGGGGGGRVGIVRMHTMTAQPLITYGTYIQTHPFLKNPGYAPSVGPFQHKEPNSCMFLMF